MHIYIRKITNNARVIEFEQLRIWIVNSATFKCIYTDNL